MKINFDNYTYFDPSRTLRGDNGEDIESINATDRGWTDIYSFDENKFNQLIANRQYNDAADYAAKFHFNDPKTQREHENDIINLRRNGRILGAIYSKVQDPKDLSKITFADNVFVDGGLERIGSNEYTSKLEEYKKQIGSEMVYDVGNHHIGKEATSLAITFSPAKRTFLGIDWLASDNKNTIDNFYSESGISLEDLRNSGVEVINKDGKTTLKFNKSNPLANKILYFAPTNSSKNRVGDTPMLDLGGDIGVNIVGYDAQGNELGYGEGITKFKELINEARSTKEAYFQKRNLESRDYSSTVGPLISDELSSLRSALNSGQIDDTQYNQQAKAIAPHIFAAINTLGSSNYEMYTNNYNDEETDETLVTVDNKKRGELANLISSYAPKDIEVSAMVSNGKIGALITLEGTGNESTANENKGRRIQIFVPGLLQEEAQAKINRNTSTRAIQELNSMVDWGYDYKLRDNSSIEVKPDGKFFNGDKELTKQEAIIAINKDMIMEDALVNLKYQYMNSDNNITDNVKYEQMSRLLAMNAVQDLYGDIKLNVNPQTQDVTLADKYGNVYNPDDIFNRKIDKDKIQYEIYDRFNEIYAMYNELMNELSFYK